MLAEFAKLKKELEINNEKPGNNKLGGKFILSFDDYQYKVANQHILDMCIENKDGKKKKGQEDDEEISQSSEDDEDDDENEEGVKEKQKQIKLFDEDDILDIEEAQDHNAFGDV